MARKKGRGRGRRSKKVEENGTVDAARGDAGVEDSGRGGEPVVGAESPESPEARDQRRRAAVQESRKAYYRMLAEVATSMWYLKTKHFRKAWDDDDPDLEDRRERRALGRLAKGIEALTEAGVEVHDPTNERYPAGGEATMKPIQLDPTPGISFATVTETVRPVVYLGQARIQRGEVFVAVPLEDDTEKSDAEKSDAENSDAENSDTEHADTESERTQEKG